MLAREVKVGTIRAVGKPQTDEEKLREHCRYDFRALVNGVDLGVMLTLVMYSRGVFEIAEKHARFRLEQAYGHYEADPHDEWSMYLVEESWYAQPHWKKL